MNPCGRETFDLKTLDSSESSLEAGQPMLAVAPEKCPFLAEHFLCLGSPAGSCRQWLCAVRTTTTHARVLCFHFETSQGDSCFG